RNTTEAAACASAGEDAAVSFDLRPAPGISKSARVCAQSGQVARLALGWLANPARAQRPAPAPVSPARASTGLPPATAPARRSYLAEVEAEHSPLRRSPGAQSPCAVAPPAACGVHPTLPPYRLRGRVAG